MDGGSGQSLSNRNKKKFRGAIDRGETKFPGLLQKSVVQMKVKVKEAAKVFEILCTWTSSSTSTLSAVGQCNQIDRNSKQE